ncbi:hypothetical protein [Mucilaginibacter sp. KACC 22063]|uniref:hypothetical protein n=1 Tax=Mucilaginibacter sp. KACC 22063 TaxID=3025666 RepID=UPI0023663767|nr:hypothetical protein [Mucilaginibacter sp. KACC 22063]WDF54662.1 hypothetical protein PQ461_17150 [Mucilaginibacter sp. KACC 22063]
MKTYLPQIERRITVRPNQTYGILNYDIDNAYPQRMLELVAASPTAKDCWNKRARFIAGRGFEVSDLGKELVNDQGLSLAKLLKAVATDKALFTGFGIHINYNANFKIASLNYVKFEDIRLGDTDSPETAGKYAIYNDWGRKTWKNIMRSKITFLAKYNPDPEVIIEQVVAAGGWDNYKGQLYYLNPEVDDYPLIEADSVWEDFETEAGIKTFNNREVTTGFLPSTMLFMQSRREDADNASPFANDDFPSVNMPTQLERDLGVFQGAKSAQKILVIEYEDESAKPEVKPYPIQNNDKLFETTERSVESRIIKGFSVPKELVNAEKSTGLSNGGEKKQAIREFNDNTSPERIELSETFAEILTNFYRPINPSGNWNIIPIPAEVADDSIGIIAGDKLNQLLLSELPAENKKAILIYAYGFKKEEAEAMVVTNKPLKSR